MGFPTANHWQPPSACRQHSLAPLLTQLHYPPSLPKELLINLYWKAHWGWNITLHAASPKTVQQFSMYDTANCVCVCVMWQCSCLYLGALWCYLLICPEKSVIDLPFNTTGYILAHWYYHLAWGFHQFHVLSLLSSRALTPNNLLGHLPHSRGAAANSLPLFPKFYALDAQMICTYWDWFYLIQIFSNSASNY